MRRDPVASSNVRSVGHDAGNSVLEVEYRNGGVYRYADVSAEEHAELICAESIGKALGAFKKLKPCTRVYGCCGEAFDAAAVTHDCAKAAA